jgi:hypothetical protein
VTAKRKFCESQSLRDWSLHAGRIKISAADFLSKTACDLRAPITVPQP